MKGDFSRITFNAQNHFSRVLMQQGRVQLDADWNEQAAIVSHYLQSLAKDLIGPYGGPGEGFKIVPNDDDHDFEIHSGHYYVDGILCENEGDAIYSEQYLMDESKLAADETYMVYLDVWERHITYIQEESIREVALGGPDTATRAQIVWQVKVLPQDELDIEFDVSPPVDYCEIIHENWKQIVQKLDQKYRGKLKAKSDNSEQNIKDNPCLSSPESNYRGPENQLYRVEIHGGGDIDPTFKWSRENGSVVFPIRSLAGNTVTLEHLGRDSRLGLKVGDWVEIVDDESVLKNKPYPLLRVDEIDAIEQRIILSNMGNEPLPVYEEDAPKHPLLRRWDHQEGVKEHGGAELLDEKYGALKISEDAWIKLEDGVQIYFKSARAGETNTYRSGDYWLIPARTATGRIEWPEDGKEEPKALPPQGIHHHYAPLALITFVGGKIIEEESTDCRCVFPTLCDIAKLLENFSGGSPGM